MCIHLAPLENYLRAKNIAEVWRGQPWTKNCREWIYFDCSFDAAGLKAKLGLDPVVEVHDYPDVKAGSEAGLFCTACKDGVMGLHSSNPLSMQKPFIT